MPIPQFIESIRLKNGQLINIGYHSARMNVARTEYKLTKTPYNLEGFFKHITLPKNGLWKCRILYDTRIHKIHYQQYYPKKIDSLKVVIDDSIEYEHKLAERRHLTKLYTQRGNSDDIIISKQGMVTDSYYGNLLFLKNGTWYTPETYLLRGTQRQYLLDQKKIEIAKIRVEDIRQYEKVKIINAMLDLENGPEIDAKNVRY